MNTTASLFHLRMTIHGRRRKDSITQRVSYISGTALRDTYTGQLCSNTAKRGVLRHACVGFPGSYAELATLVDASEKRQDANTCRELVVALPHGLSERQRWRILVRVAQKLCSRWGVVAVVALHLPGAHGDERNDHGHIVFSSRVFSNCRFGRKTRELDVMRTGRIELTWLREVASTIICRCLKSVGRSADCPLWDHRSYLDRGILRPATIHDGLTRRQIKLKNGLHKQVFDDVCTLSPAEQSKLAALVQRHRKAKAAAVAAPNPLPSESEIDYLEQRLRRLGNAEKAEPCAPCTLLP